MKAGSVAHPAAAATKKGDRRYKYTYRVRDERPGSRWWVRLLLGAFTFLYLCGGLLFGLVFVSRGNTLAQSFLAQFIDLPITLSVNFPVNLVSTTEAPPDWAGKERVNILLIGIDRRPTEDGAPGRTDSMIVATLDPYSRTAGMLSIPRDLWVPIPLGGGRVMEERLNAAFVVGELNKYPGGGIGLMRRTVEYNLGVRIHYYALVEFEGFRQIVNAVDGIVLDVKKPVRDDEYPTEDYGIKRVYIPAGLQWMDGETALQYARTRHQDSDFGRIRRQREVVMAIRGRALQLDLLPQLPQLLLQLKDVVRTDLSVTEIVALARVASQVDGEQIVSRALDGDAVLPYTTELGADILLPRRAAMESIMAEVFFDARLRDESPRVEIVVPAARSSTGKALVDYLKRRGIPQTILSLGGDAGRSQTQMLLYGKKGYSADKVAELIGLPVGRVEPGDPAEVDLDVRVLLGSDVKLPGGS